MKTEPSKTIREVWDAKEAACKETEKLHSSKDFFNHLRANNPDIGLPRIRMQPHHKTKLD